uniref:G_PROTEIN_RECEP_F1_2 domain-containing protein n=1 Tax=Caenorhabditis tropicalis TaxID=1561998 RepID=A0A1I7V257_9PELO
MFDTDLVSKYIPRVFGTLAFIVNPIFVYLIFTEKTAKLGNYRYVLLYFAVFNLVYSVGNIAIPIIMKKLNRLTDRMSRKTSNLQMDLLRALIVQTVIPIFISFLPCVISFFSPAFNFELGRPMNYVEVIALGAFAFCDPVAIVICLPVFRKRVMCREKQSKADNVPKTMETVVA